MKKKRHYEHVCARCGNGFNPYSLTVTSICWPCCFEDAEKAAIDQGTILSVDKLLKDIKLTRKSEEPPRPNFPTPQLPCQMCSGYNWVGHYYPSSKTFIEYMCVYCQAIDRVLIDRVKVREYFKQFE